MKIAARISRISVSQTMAVGEAARKLRDQGVDVVDFGPGGPHFPTPQNIKQAAIKAINPHFTKYTAVGGIRDLRKAVVEKHTRDFGSHYDIGECLINMGGKHAIFNVVESLVDDGEEVIIPTPYWVSFLDIVQFVGAKPVFVHTREDE